MRKSYFPSKIVVFLRSLLHSIPPPHLLSFRISPRQPIIFTRQTYHRLYHRNLELLFHSVLTERTVAKANESRFFFKLWEILCDTKLHCLEQAEFTLNDVSNIFVKLSTQSANTCIYVVHSSRVKEPNPRQTDVKKRKFIPSAILHMFS